jgi:hypothetical protein
VPSNVNTTILHFLSVDLHVLQVLTYQAAYFMNIWQRHHVSLFKSINYAFNTEMNQVIFSGFGPELHAHVFMPQILCAA